MVYNENKRDIKKKKNKNISIICDVIKIIIENENKKGRESLCILEYFSNF